MPRRSTSIRTNRAARKRRLRNLKIKQGIKKTLKKFYKLIASKNLEEAKKIFTQLTSQLDKAAKKGIIHSNTADRKKSRLALQLQKLMKTHQ